MTDFTVNGAFAGAGELDLPTGGCSAAAFTIGGTFTGLAATFQGLVFGQTTWQNIPFLLQGNGGSMPTVTVPTTGNVTAAGTYVVNAAGFSQVRLLVASISTGSITAFAESSSGGGFGYTLAYIAGSNSLVATVSNPGSISTGAAFGPSLNTNAQQFFWNGASQDSARTPVIYKQLSAVAVGSEITIWTPAAGKKFRLMGYTFTQGVATGAIALKDNTAGTTIFTVPQNTLGAAFNSPNMGNGILSAAANNVLTATGVATETLTGTVYGTEE